MAEVAIKSLHLPYNQLAKKKSARQDQFIRGFNYWFKYENDEKEIERLMELMKNTAIMEDDIEDSSILRRGRPCSYRIYGIPQTVNSIVYYNFELLDGLLKITSKEKIPEMVKKYIDQIKSGHEGQACEMFWRENLIVPSEEDFQKMVILKAGYFIKFPYMIFKILSGKDINLDRLCDLMSLYSQYVNDVQNLKETEYAESKSFAEDISEGKFTMPLIHAINAFPEDKTIITILKMKTQDIEIKKVVLDYLEKAKSFEYCEKKIEEFRLAIIDELSRLDENPIFNEIMSNKMYY